MTRLATTAGFLAALAWLITSRGCEASLVPKSSMFFSSSSLSSTAERQSVDEIGRTNLRPAALSSSSSSSAGILQSSTPQQGWKQTDASPALQHKENNEERVKHRIKRQEATDGSHRNNPFKILGKSAAMTTKDSTSVKDWSKQLGMAKKHWNQRSNSFHAKEGKKAARARFLSKSHSKNKVTTPYSSFPPLASSAPFTLASSTTSTSHISPSSTNLRRTQESPALAACWTAAENHVVLSDTATCNCSEDPNTVGQYILECVEPCTYCSDTNTTRICAKASNQLFFEAETGANSARSKSYAYNIGRDETITVLETGCSLNAYGIGNCTECVASVDGTTCNSCFIQACDIPYYDDEYEYFSPVLDCTNIGSSAVYNFCDFPIIEANDPLHAIGNAGFSYCANLGTAACEAEKATREAESDSMFCHCIDVEVRCADNCGLFCNDGGDMCGRAFETVIFSKYLGSVVYTSEVFEYRDGHRHQLTVYEGESLCYYSFLDPDWIVTADCKCRVQTCADGTEAPMVDCTLMGGDVSDRCQSYPVEPGKMFVHPSFDNCIDLSPDNDACSDSDEPLALDGSTISGALRNAMYFDAPSCGDIDDYAGLYYNVMGNNTGVRVSTCCSNETSIFDTPFYTELSVYEGSCDDLQCVTFGYFSNVLFFGEQDVMYHLRVHGYDKEKGDFALTVEAVNIAMLSCEEFRQNTANPYLYSGRVCECIENGNDAKLTCHDECTYCNTDKSICATKTTTSTITAAYRTVVTAKSATFNYTKGLDGVLEFETTECYFEPTEFVIDSIEFDIAQFCSACRVMYNDKECNTCTPSFSSEGYPGFDVNCTNIDHNATFSINDPNAFFSIYIDPAATATNSITTMESSGPLQVLSSDAFSACVRDPLEVCKIRKANEEGISATIRCNCSGSYAGGATMVCTDPSCLLSCNSDYTVCWRDSFGIVFDANGQESSRLEIITYTEGRDEVVIWESPGSGTCRMTFNGTACNSCGSITCPDTSGLTATAVDCENVERGSSFDTCTDYGLRYGYAIQGQTGVLQAFNQYENVECLVVASAETVCQQQVEQKLLEGFACDCALDAVTGEDYLLTCVKDPSCLLCNAENTVCANVSGRDTINKYGQVTSSVVSYTYMSGRRDETVVLGNLANSGGGRVGGGVGRGETCYITVNGISCNSCGPITCMNECGDEYDGVAVDCENIETGASFDNCDKGQYFFVDTGVLEVVSNFEFEFCRGDEPTGPTPNDDAIP